MKQKIYFILPFLFFSVFIMAQGDQAAPDFTLPDLDGNDFQLAKNLEDGPTLINFWATWCIPCKAEMKKLKAIFETYREKGLKILSISIDNKKTAGKVKAFVKANKYPFTILLDTDNAVFKLYQGTYPPMTVLIDTKGKIVYQHVGYRKGDEKKLEVQIINLLK